MSGNEKYYIPKHLDAAPRIIFWSVDEVMMFFIPFMMGFMFNIGLIGLIAAFSTFRFWKKFKRKGGHQTIRYFIYWFYPPSFLGLKSTPPSSTKNYIG